MHRKTIVANLMGLFLLATVCAFAADDANVKGMIISRAGDMLIVSNQSGRTTVLLNDDTKTKDNTGLFGLDEDMSAAVLIPGLKVDIDGMADGPGRIVAKTITVDGDDLEAAEMIQAGLHPTAQQVAANQKGVSSNRQDIQALQQSAARNAQAIEANQRSIQAHQQQLQASMKEMEENTARFMALSDYNVKYQATVRFDVGKSEISTAHEEELQKLAQNALTSAGYIIEVVGFADSTGNAAINQKLSEDRAKAVIAYLIQQCHVPVRHIVAPGAMGHYQPAASNETPTGRAENRRVEIKVLTNKNTAGN